MEKMPPIFLGTKTQIYSQTTLADSNVPIDFYVWLNIDTFLWPSQPELLAFPLNPTNKENTFPLRLIFKIIGNVDFKEPTTSWKSLESGTVEFTVAGWNALAPASLPNDVEIGTAFDRKIYINFTLSTLGTKNLLTLFVYLGDKK